MLLIALLGMFYMGQKNKSTACLNDFFTTLGFTIEFLLQTVIIGLKSLKKRDIRKIVMIWETQ